MNKGKSGYQLLDSAIAPAWLGIRDYALACSTPIDALRNECKTKKQGEGGTQLRKALVVFQFAISIVLIIGTAVSYQQIAFMQSEDPGFDRNNLVTMPLFQTDRVMRNRDQGEPILAWRYNQVKDAFMQHPNVITVSAFRAPLGSGQEITRTVQPEDKPTDWRMPMNEVDEDFLDLYELELDSGRNFSAEIQSDRT